MLKTILLFLAGAWTGGLIGVLVMALLQVQRKN